jgi:hypothetical protein
MQYKPILSASLSIQTGINAKCPVLVISDTLSGIELRTGGHKYYLSSVLKGLRKSIKSLIIKN